MGIYPKPIEIWNLKFEIIYLPKKGRRPPQIARANQGGGHQKKNKWKKKKKYNK